MYHDIVKHGDKVAIIMDSHDLSLLVFLLGKQCGDDDSSTKVLVNAYRRLVGRDEHHPPKYTLHAQESGSGGYSWTIKEK